MVRVSISLWLVTTFLVFTTASFAQEKVTPAQAIGKRVVLTVNHKNDDGKFTCTGVIVQVDQEKLILEDVTKTDTVEHGVPFLSNIKDQGKLFKNVGACKTTKLEFGIVLPLKRIRACQLLEEKDDAKSKKDSVEILLIADRICEEVNEAVELIRKNPAKMK